MAQILKLPYNSEEALPILVLQRENNVQLILELESESSVSIFNVQVGEYPTKRLGMDILLENISYVVYLEDKVVFESVGEDMVNLLEIYEGGSFKLNLGLDKGSYKPVWVDKRVEI